MRRAATQTLGGALITIMLVLQVLFTNYIRCFNCYSLFFFSYIPSPTTNNNQVLFCSNSQASYWLSNLEQEAIICACAERSKVTHASLLAPSTFLFKKKIWSDTFWSVHICTTCPSHLILPDINQIILKLFTV